MPLVITKMHEPTEMMEPSSKEDTPHNSSNTEERLHGGNQDISFKTELLNGNKKDRITTGDNHLNSTNSDTSTNAQDFFNGNSPGPEQHLNFTNQDKSLIVNVNETSDYQAKSPTDGKGFINFSGYGIVITEVKCGSSAEAEERIEIRSKAVIQDESYNNEDKSEIVADDLNTRLPRGGQYVSPVTEDNVINLDTVPASEQPELLTNGFEDTFSVLTTPLSDGVKSNFSEAEPISSSDNQNSSVRRKLQISNGNNQHPFYSRDIFSESIHDETFPSTEEFVISTNPKRVSEGVSCENQDGLSVKEDLKTDNNATFCLPDDNLKDNTRVSEPDREQLLCNKTQNQESVRVETDFHRNTDEKSSSSDKVFNRSSIEEDKNQESFSGLEGLTNESVHFELVEQLSHNKQLHLQNQNRISTTEVNSSISDSVSNRSSIEGGKNQESFSRLEGLADASVHFELVEPLSPNKQLHLQNQNRLSTTEVSLNQDRSPNTENNLSTERSPVAEKSLSTERSPVAEKSLSTERSPVAEKSLNQDCSHVTEERFDQYRSPIDRSLVANENLNHTLNEEKSLARQEDLIQDKPPVADQDSDQDRSVTGKDLGQDRFPAARKSVHQDRSPNAKKSLHQDTTETVLRENLNFVAENPLISDSQVIEENTEESDSEKLLPSEMADMVEKVNQQQAEISDLKLKLNAAQQHNASLELQIAQNEEIVIKTQAEALRTEQNYQQEVKQLKEKLNENSKIIEKDRLRELEDQVRDSKARETKLMAELAQRTKDDVNYQKIMDQYEFSLKSHLAEYKKLQEENETVKMHLTNLELAFSDVHSKYERTKTTIQGLKANEEALLGGLEVAQATNIQHEERYESLKAHARTQIEKSNKEIHTMKELHEADANKLKALIRRLEIKVSSLEVSLQQKSEECEQLSALCDEVTGKKI